MRLSMAVSGLSAAILLSQIAAVVGAGGEENALGKRSTSGVVGTPEEAVLEIEDEGFWGRFLGEAGSVVKPTPKPSDCGGPTDPCPCPTDVCMNSENFLQCKTLEEGGCKNILILESCPLQFRCGDINCGWPTYPCPCPTDACMNDKNFLLCKMLEEGGCKNILILESCPLQFRCGDSNPTCADVAGFDFGDECDAFFGFGVLGGTCQSISGCDSKGYLFFPTIEECQATCVVGTASKLQKELDEARSLWESQDIDGYDFYYQQSCECLPDVFRPKIVKVRDNAVQSAIFADDGSVVPKDIVGWISTIEELFDKVQEAILIKADEVVVEYDKTLGHLVSIFIDYDKAVADEEFIVQTSDLIPFVDPQIALDKARSQWDSLALEHYDYQYQKLCFCLEKYRRPMIVHVRNNIVNVATYVSDNSIVPMDVVAQVPTIDGLFEIIQEAIDKDAAVVSVTYDKGTGLPADVNIDYDERIADEELYVTAGNLIEPPGPVPCNKAICSSDQYCCNPSCSICAPLKGFCIQIACPPEPDPSTEAFIEARSLWDSQALEDYDYQVQRICFCQKEYTRPMIAQVRNGKVNKVTFASDGNIVPKDIAQLVPTIDDLFVIIEEALDEGVFYFSAKYDSATGYPTEIDINYDEMIADEEVFILASDLRDPSGSLP